MHWKQIKMYILANKKGKSWQFILQLNRFILQEEILQPTLLGANTSHPSWHFCKWFPFPKVGYGLLPWRIIFTPNYLKPLRIKVNLGIGCGSFCWPPMSKNGFPGTPFKQDLVIPPWIRLVYIYIVLSDTSKLLSIYILIEISFHLLQHFLLDVFLDMIPLPSIENLRVFVTHDSIVIFSS